jgi:hypothetical protein
VRHRWIVALVCAGATAHARPPLQSFDSPTAALVSLLRQKPRVIAFGEYHEIEGAPKVRSAIRHFLDELLPTLAPLASDLIVETWVTEGRCGKREEETVAQVHEDTKRPESTEDEIVTLIERAKARGVAPHILTVSCLEYLMITGGSDKVDYMRLLSTISNKLQEKIEEVLGTRGKDRKRAVLVYGGAIHNKLRPTRELRDYSFAPEINKKVRGRFLEVDLYVPEYVEKDEQVTAEPWYAPWSKSDPAKTALVRRGPRSWIIVFPRGDGAPAPEHGELHDGRGPM